VRVNRLNFYALPSLQLLSFLISFLTCLAPTFVLARTLVFLTAADSTTNAMSATTHTEATNPKITVFDSLEGNVLRLDY
jgi:hypothetical protein